MTAAVDLDRDVQARLVQLLYAASLEIAPKPATVEVLRGDFDPGVEVFVNQTPEGSGEDVVATATALRRAGFEPVPHIAARNLAGVADIDDHLARLSGEAAVNRVLVIAGDRRQSRGPFATVVELLEAGRIEASGIGTVGIAAHPEGNPFADRATLERGLVAKFSRVREAGLACFLVTQFCFEAAPILAFVASLDRLAIDAPVRIGVAGPAPLATLIRFAERCGIGPSLNTLKNRPKTVGRLIGDIGPEDVLHDLAAGLSQAAADRVAGIHFYPFGGVAKTSTWLEAALSRLYESMAGEGAGAARLSG